MCVFRASLQRSENFCTLSPQANYPMCWRVSFRASFVHLYNAAKIFCALTCGLSSRWRATCGFPPIMPINWGIESKHYTCAAGQSLFSIFPFYPPLIGFIGLIDTFPQKCGQNRPKLGVNQISPLTSIDSGKALWKFLVGQPCGKQRGLHVRYTCYPSV